jgi:hypothetical protein
LSYNAKVYMAQGGDELVVNGGKITAAGTQANHVADVAVTATLTGVDTGTDMTAAQAATIVTDITALKTAVNAILAALEGVGILKTS